MSLKALIRIVQVGQIQGQSPSQNRVQMKVTGGEEGIVREEEGTKQNMGHYLFIQIY